MQKEYRWHPQEERAIGAVFETKGSRILESAMNKIRNGQDKGKWITTNVRAALDEHWGSTDFLNKSSTTKANPSVDRGASTYCGGSISTAAHFEKLSKEFQRSSTAWEVMEKTKKLKSGEWVNDKSREFAIEEGTSTQDSPNTATSVNDNEIYLNVVGGPNYKGNVAKENKEKTLEERMLQMMKNHDHQSQEMRQ
ncbi:hypothetical protein GmHk_12G034894 [Glycine max]|nr:hypothetical protein GmHk_12G034894 [Glycine max]